MAGHHGSNLMLESTDTWHCTSLEVHMMDPKANLQQLGLAMCITGSVGISKGFNMHPGERAGFDYLLKRSAAVKQSSLLAQLASDPIIIGHEESKQG